VATIEHGLKPAGWLRSADRFLALASASHARALAVLLLVSLAAFLPGFLDIPPTDRDEARFAQATKQMLESGDYIDIRFQNEVRYKKPVGIYWLQAGVVRAGEALGLPHARTTIWLYRIPSLIGAIGAVLLTYWAGLAMLRRRYAFLAAAMLATSVLLTVEARIAKTDSALLMTIVAAFGVLARAYLDPSSLKRRSILLPAVFWTALAAGFLLKGPVNLMVVGLTVATLGIIDRSLAWTKALRPALGAAWFLLLVLPWFVAIMGRAGEAFLAESVGHDMLAKVFSGQESHGAPPGLYFLLFWVTFWPAAPLAALAAPAAWRERNKADVRLLLAWIVPAWIVFELVITKLPHYVLPLYPAVAILTARMIERGMLAAAPRLEWLTLSWPIMTVAAGLLGVAGLVAFAGWTALAAVPFAAAAAALGVLAWRAYTPTDAERILMPVAGAAIVLYATVFGIVFPSLRIGFPSPTLAQAIAAVPCEPRAVASAGFHEPSLVFLVGTDTRLTDGAGVADFLHAGGCRIGLVESRAEDAFVHRAETLKLRYAPAGHVDAFAVNGGRMLSIALYRAVSP
jgi:4-amino-4-deoxy-L-arabinose transferase-like glycosyltransferase